DVSNRRVGGEGDFNFLRSDAVPRTLDDVILARNKPEVAILIGMYEVTGPVPALGGNGVALFVRVAPVDGTGRSASDELTNGTGLGIFVLLVDDFQLVPGHGLAEGTRLGLAADHVGGENVHHLSRAQPLEDLQAEFLFPGMISHSSQ